MPPPPGPAPVTGRATPPWLPTRFQNNQDVATAWTAWYDKLKDAYRLQTRDITRLRAELCVKRASAKKETATTDWDDKPSKQGTAYDQAFHKGKGGASAAAGAYGPDDDNPGGPPIWHTNPDIVMAIQAKYFAGLVKTTVWNRAPDDPAAAPKTTPSAGFAAHLAERKTTDYEPYLKQEVSGERFRDLLSKASFTSAAGPSGLSYTLIALSSPAFQGVIRALINYALKHGVVPKGW